MSQPPTSALSCPFAWVTNPSGYDFVIYVSAVPTGFNLPSSLYQMFMGPSTSSNPALPADALTTLVAQLNAFYLGTPTFAFTMDPVSGRWTLACSTAFTFTAVNATFTTVFGNLTPIGATAYKSVYPPRFLILFNSEVGDDWQQQTPLAGETDEGGSVYAITSGITRSTDELDLKWLPRDPTTQTREGTTVSPWFPDDQYLPLVGAGLNASAAPWDISNHLIASLGLNQSLARGTWPALCADPTAYYDIVTIPPEEAAAPRVKMQFTAWKAWRAWKTKITRLAATPVGNRT